MTKIKSKKTEQRELDNVWKKKVKDRDKWTCQICRKKVVGKNCHAHHILPKGIKGMRWDVNNGITLCYAHHNQIRGKEECYVKMFHEIIIKKIKDKNE